MRQTRSMSSLPALRASSSRASTARRSRSTCSGAATASARSALLTETVRTATVRASSPVLAYRLGSSVFTALDALPPGSTRGVPDARRHAVALELLPRALELRAAVERGAGIARLAARARHRSRRRDRRARRRPARPDVRDRAGPACASSRSMPARRRTSSFLRTGDFFGERSLFLEEPRAASVQAVSESTLLRFPPSSFAACLPSTRTSGSRLEQRIQQYDYRRVANVPLDFAEELLPADALLQQVSPEQVEPRAGRGRARRDGRRDGAATDPARSRTSTSSTRWIAAPPASRWSAATSAAPSPSPHIRELVHTSTDGTTPAGITGGAEELGLDGALGARVEEPARRAATARGRPLGGQPLGRRCIASTTSTSASPIRRAGLRRIPREEFLRQWSGYAAAVDYTERLADAPEARTSLAWLKPFLRPHLRLVAARGRLLAIVAASLEIALPILTQVVVDRVLPHARPTRCSGSLIGGDRRRARSR